MRRPEERGNPNWNIEVCLGARMTLRCLRVKACHSRHQRTLVQYPIGEV
jgi:hypothetical protein